ncbi:MAG TPA: trypsin-like peptidase domain-containing protein, partial [Longimicrobium sp.]|nr:trypsin-like peptidase domain-containing protein [Longimicrobium sp.]
GGQYGAPPDGARIGDYLDYAVLRLNGTPGRERGAYRLDPERWPSKGRTTWVVHHPAQYNQRAAFGKIVELWPDEKGARVFHTAGTDSGSSGGVVLDDAYEAVALHQCAVRDAQGKIIHNGAIPTAPIARSVQGTGVLGISGTCDPLWRLPDTGEPPVFGRDRFQQLVWRARSGGTHGPHLIVVSGPAESGKSFSTQILRASLPPDEHVVIAVSAAAIPADAAALAADILRLVEPPALAGAATPLPASDQTTSTYNVWIKDTLFPRFAQRLKEAVGGRLAWLVIDDLEHHTLPDASARVFLQVLYASLASTLTSLRVVLIGLDGPVPGVDGRTGVVVENDRIDRPTADDVATYLRRRCVAEEITLTGDDATRWGQVAVSMAETLSDARKLAERAVAATAADPLTGEGKSSFVSVLPEVVLRNIIPVLSR